MLKAEARKFFKEKRKEITVAQKLKLDDLLLIQFQKVQLPFLSSILSFYPLEIQKEINTFIITDYLHFTNPDLKICYPKINEASETFIAIAAEEDENFILNKYGIPEPDSDNEMNPQHLDAVLVPLLCFDKKGYRAGYGKGFYDRFLQSCRTDCIKIGLSYFEPVELLDDAADYDVPLDICITPQKAYVF